MKYFGQFLSLSKKSPICSPKSWNDKTLQREFDPSTIHISCVKIPYGHSWWNRTKSTGIIPEKPTSHVRFGLVKVIITVIVGTKTGKYLGEFIWNNLKED